MNWGSIADWVSGLGSISASAVALYLAGSERRAQRARERPEISAELGEIEDDGWTTATITILNTAHKEWQLLKAEILHPKNGLVTTLEDTRIALKPWDHQFSAERRAQLAGRVKDLRRTIRPVGSVDSTAGGSQAANKIWVRLPVFVGEASTRLVLRLSFASLEPKPDRFSIDIVRMIERA